ncbi:MAG: DUF3179 domain-containing protein [Anaerolineae bacterium]|nr:DUF3179 domain-containing protein [Anaerolineae bacterium]MDQ7035798.1 DUF3179 domain-containing protein [Anaerolineae bacterium]
MKIRTFSMLSSLIAILSIVMIPLGAYAQNECESIEWIDEVFPLNDYCNNTIDITEVSPGCRFRECIPALNSDVVTMESIAEASNWLVDQSPVIAIEIDGDARAYPQAILVSHEIANDVVGGVPVAITYCPLCNSSIVYERTVNDEIYDFAVSGLLRNSDLVMFDRQTETWWQQFTGEGIVGDHAGVLLGIIPSRVIGFGQFAERYPDGQVLSRGTGGAASTYGTISAGYANYDDAFLFRGEPDPRLPETSHVLAGTIGDEAIAYPFSALAEEFVINDTVGGEDIVAMWQPGTAAMMDNVVVDNSRDIGTASLYSREVDGRVLTFSYDAASNTITDNETGSEWNLFGEAISGELEGAKLQQMFAAVHFWFAWAAFNPDTVIYGIE